MTVQITQDRGQWRVNGHLTRIEFDEIERIRNSRFYLIRNDGGEIGERGKCGRCGLLHMYFTSMCLELPFRGLEDGLRYWFQLAGESDRRSRLLDSWAMGLTDYSRAHPQSARALSPNEPGTLTWYSLVAGISEPITEAQAMRLYQKINERMGRAA